MRRASPRSGAGCGALDDRLAPFAAGQRAVVAVAAGREADAQDASAMCAGARRSSAAWIASAIRSTSSRALSTLLEQSTPPIARP